MTCCLGGFDSPALLVGAGHGREWDGQHAKSCPLKIICSYCCCKSNLNREFIILVSAESAQ